MVDLLRLGEDSLILLPEPYVLMNPYSNTPALVVDMPGAAPDETVPRFIQLPGAKLHSLTASNRWCAR